MVQLTVIAVGNMKESYLTAAIAEYRKRLSAFARVEIVEIPESPVRDEESPTAVREALDREAERILAAIPKGAAVLPLVIEGEEMTSQAFAAAIGKYTDAQGKICFIIGSSHGLSPTVKARADRAISLSRMTFPHQLARVLLMEAVYRAFTILAGKRYHK
jgi:23S rRNA (pseudouridine1915-N3)-methyltransferase